MSLENDIYQLFSQNFDNKTLIEQAKIFLTHDNSEKSLRSAFVNCAAAFISDRELLFDNKPMVLQILEIVSKLCQLKPNDNDYMQQFGAYMCMCLTEYAAELSHQLIPLALFRSIPSKILQLNLLAQPKLSNDWTSNEIKEVLAECLKDDTIQKSSVQDLVRINLIIRYCKEGAMESAREQLHLLVLKSRSEKEMLLIVHDLVDTLKADIDRNDVKTVVTLLFAEKGSKLLSFYKQCVHRALDHSLQSQTQDNCGFFSLFWTAGNAGLKELLRNSSLGQSSVDLQVAKTTDSSIPRSMAIPLPPPPPPIIKADKQKGGVAKPIESRAKTMSRKAGKEILAAINRNSGYGKTTEQSADEKSDEQKVAEKSDKQRVVEKSDLFSILERAMGARRDVIKDDVSSSDEDVNHDWDKVVSVNKSKKEETTSVIPSSSKDERESKSASKNKEHDKHKNSTRSDKSDLGKRGKSEKDHDEKKAHHKEESEAKLTRPLPPPPVSSPPPTEVISPRSQMFKHQHPSAMEMAKRFTGAINPPKPAATQSKEAYKPSESGTLNPKPNPKPAVTQSKEASTPSEMRRAKR